MSHMAHDADHTTHCETSRTVLGNRKKFVATSVEHDTSSYSTSVPSTLYSTQRRERQYGRYSSSLDEDADAEYAPSYQDAMNSRNTATAVSVSVSVVEEELVDTLPSYTPSIQLLSLCRRKQLYTSKTQRAKRRSWTVVWLFLDGTALRVYTPTREEEKGFVKEWKEKYCTSSKNVSSRTRKESSKEEEEELEDVDTYEERTRRQGGTRTNQRRDPIPITPRVGSRTRSGSMVKHPLSSSTTLTIRPSTPESISAATTSSTTTTTITKPSILTYIPRILTRQPHKSYSTRNATCTRPNSYFKRPFVVELTLGENEERFLVQLNDYEETQAWVNAMAVAAPLALDLDERVMVEPSPFPRHHRHTRSGSLSLSTHLTRSVSDDDDEQPQRRQVQSEVTTTETIILDNGIVRPARRRPSTAPAAL